MWPDLKETPVEDYEYALAGNGKGPYGRPPTVFLFHLSPGALGAMLGGALVIGAIAGWRLATLFED